MISEEPFLLRNLPKLSPSVFDTNCCSPAQLQNLPFCFDPIKYFQDITHMLPHGIYLHPHILIS